MKRGRCLFLHAEIVSGERDSAHPSLRLTETQSPCNREGAQGSSGGTALALLVARPARPPGEAHVRSVGSYAGQLSAAVGVVPLHARTR